MRPSLVPVFFYSGLGRGVDGPELRGKDLPLGLEFGVLPLDVPVIEVRPRAEDQTNERPPARGAGDLPRGGPARGRRTAEAVGKSVECRARGGQDQVIQHHARARGQGDVEKDGAHDN